VDLHVAENTIQELWCHLLVTDAFLARPGASLQWTEEIAMAFFNFKGMYG
jgi:hypothetical protein